MRTLPLTGLEWSFLMVDEGYSQNGFKVERDEE